jgi:hypothetical protein
MARLKVFGHFRTIAEEIATRKMRRFRLSLMFSANAVKAASTAL